MVLRLLFTLVLICSTVSAQIQIAVVDFEANGVSNPEAKALTDRLAVELFRTGYFSVLEREMLNKILNEQDFQRSGCTTNECLVEIGKIANVQQIIGGSVSKVGNVFSISVFVFLTFGTDLHKI